MTMEFRADEHASNLNPGAARSGGGRIVVCVGGPTREEALDQIVLAGTLADLVELRLDRIAGARPEELIPASPVPVIATVRTRREGGDWERPDAACAGLLARALDAGAACVDVEFGLPERLRKELAKQAGPGRVILSRHTTRHTPSTEVLTELLETMARERPAVVKIVCRARTASDVFRVLALIPRAGTLGVGVSAFCMGAAGRTSRLLSLRLGASLGYAALIEGGETAEGQIPVSEMQRMLSNAPLQPDINPLFEMGGSP
ncbi:MAG: type I 3-dehydroquinate dehydratase [Deltaproteobacteria bacterium]|nr:type I 3-dehydroquinate dehydratase [Deltaproteobacteria bacterium]